jgi:hypothetical protein
LDIAKKFVYCGCDGVEIQNKKKIGAVANEVADSLIVVDEVQYHKKERIVLLAHVD